MTIEDGRIQRAGAMIKATGTEGRMQQIIADYGRDSLNPERNGLNVSSILMAPAGRTGTYGAYFDACIDTDDFRMNYVGAGLIFSREKTSRQEVEKKLKERNNPK